MPRSFAFAWIPLLLMLAACSGAPTAATPAATEPLPIPAITTEPPAPAMTEPVEEPSPAVTAGPQETPLPFDATTFQDESLGFRFDYPAAWTLENQGVLGDRGAGFQLTEGGEVRMNVTVLRWDPVNDLEAFVAARRQAWSASEFELLSEEQVTLSSGHRAARFVIETPDGERALFFFTALLDRYLEMNGAGELELLAQVSQTLWLRQPLDQAGDTLPFDCEAVGETDQTGWTVCNVVAGLRSRNLSALHGFMADPFTVGYWGSEGFSASPEEITAELARYRLPADPSSPLTFTSEPGDFPPLAGQSPERLFGPDPDVVQVVYSEGWGLDGRGAALLYFVRDGSGDISWRALAFSDGRFDK